MRGKLFFSRWEFFATGMMMLAVAAPAQITLTANDVLGLIGKTQTVEEDTTDNVTVNVGAAGANRIWDFRSLILHAETLTNQFVTPAGTPFAAHVPQANFVEKITSTVEPNTATYLYLQVSNNAAQALGGGIISPFGSFFNFANAQNVFSPLPLQMGATWVSVDSDTTGDLQTGATIFVTTSNNTVDAWGLMRLPAGDFDCLRIRHNHETIFKTVIGETTISTDTSRTIEYSWVTKNDFIIATISSRDGETDPNFTSATSFTRLASKTTAIASPQVNVNFPAAFTLSQNFPNPFSVQGSFSNRGTEISFQLTRSEVVELSVYTIAGEKVRILMAGTVPPGRHAVHWNGADEYGRRLASGTYVYRLKAGNLQTARKLVILQ